MKHHGTAMKLMDRLVHIVGITFFGGLLLALIMGVAYGDDASNAVFGLMFLVQCVSGLIMVVASCFEDD